MPYEELTILRSNENDVRVYIDTTEDKLEAMPAFEGGIQLATRKSCRLGRECRGGTVGGNSTGRANPG